MTLVPGAQLRVRQTITKIRDHSKPEHNLLGVRLAADLVKQRRRIAMPTIL